jgi:hypothetical protein
MLAARSWLESPLALNVATALGTVLAGVGAIWVVLRAGPHYRLRYGMGNSKKLADGSWQVEIYLWNNGRRDITSHAFAEGKPLELYPHVHIQKFLADDTWNSLPDVRIIDVRAEDRRLLVGPGLISRNQQLRFTVIADAKPHGMHAQASLINVDVQRWSLNPQQRLVISEIILVLAFYPAVKFGTAIVRSFGVHVQPLVQFGIFGLGCFLIGWWLYDRYPYP